MELKDADEHFRRLSIWGFTFIRLLTTWEAIEHKGPGIYDYEYLEYFKQIIKIAAKYNISCFVDFHQDVWSRWTGGDGAPGWTLDVVGFNITNFHESHAAYIHQKIAPGTELPIMVDWRQQQCLHCFMAVIYLLQTLPLKENQYRIIFKIIF